MPKKGRAAGGKRNYLFSGLLFCNECQHPMVIHGNASENSRHYRCSYAMKRGICANRLGVRENVARRRLIDSLRTEIFSKDAIVYVRRVLAERLGAQSREIDREIAERRTRNERTKMQIQRLIMHIADGQGSPAITTALQNLEAQAADEKRIIQDLERQGMEPIRLPTPAELLNRVLEFEALLTEDVVAAREVLRQLFEGGRISMEPSGDGTDTARTGVCPLVIITAERFSANRSRQSSSDPESYYRRPGHSGAPMNSYGSGGRI